MEIDNIAVGNRIKSIRLDKGATMEEFGKFFNTSKGTVNNWEKGRNLPNKENLLKIAKLGNMTVSQLINGETGISHYNWEYISDIMKQYFNNYPIDKVAFKNTQTIVDLAFFLNLGIDDIINIYLYQKENKKPLGTLEELQKYFEITSDGLMSYSDSVDGEALMDLEIQASFLNSYAYKINKYLNTGVWASPTISRLKKNKPTN
ncbi:helix-turn-helix domain-containing protein [Streptococcus caballi]|uniref:helix-turn-helix domain-containing protein n=1 Tax=Streptococcus caballi TaxID=439220 RepID=UPI000364039D|nr:helix-turn-helix transcriptional regulator [Streptococcus caballi]QBX13494.1 XRE family transcriptional regulator [Streptococcus satellite phage Javan86]